MTKREMILRGLTDNELKAALMQLEEDKEREKDATRRAKMERIKDALIKESLRRQGI